MFVCWLLKVVGSRHSLNLKFPHLNSRLIDRQMEKVFFEFSNFVFVMQLRCVAIE